MTQFVEIRGGRLAVQVFEPQQHRGDALLIHGYTGSKEDFGEIGPLLAAAGYRVVTSDNRGQHESEHSDDANDYDIRSLASDHAALAARFGLDRPHLLGHSFGGLVAQRAAVEYPELWSSLTIFCSGPGGTLGGYDLESDIEFLQSGSMDELWIADRAEKNAGRKFYDVRVKRWHMSDKQSVIRHATHLISEPSIIAEVGATGLPIHVVRGENDDAWTHEEQAAMAHELGVPVTVIPQTGHCPNEDDPETTASVIAEFWNRAD